MTPNPVWITLDAERGPAQWEAFVKEAAPYGVILFARHLKSPQQVRDLNALIHEAVLGWAPRIALDQEGGRVNRLASLGMAFPSAADMSGDPERTRTLALDMGEHLKDLGFDVDFAPVADLGPAHAGTGLEGRVYSDEPAAVTACCEAFLHGLAGAGIAGCLKHFPGLGGSRVDSHRGLPSMEGGEAERRPHLDPYEALVGRVPYVMVAHGAYPAFLGSDTPSTLCSRTYGILAGLGFTGLSITDDLGMGAVSGLMDLPALAECALSAGASLALWASSQEASLRALDSLLGRPAFLANRRALGIWLERGDNRP